jgi:hypothetical protein
MRVARIYGTLPGRMEAIRSPERGVHIIYVADSQSNEKVNPPFRQGIRIGSVRDGKVTAFISAPPSEEMPEGVVADKQGNVFGGFTQIPAASRRFLT